MIFEWDESKALSNLAKHRVGFLEAATIFRDFFSITIADPDHSQDENRYITIGRSEKNNLLVVVHSDMDETIRLISAQKPGKSERRMYEEK